MADLEQAKQSFAAFVNERGGRLIVALDPSEIPADVVGTSRATFQLWPDDSGALARFIVNEFIVREATRKEFDACRWPVHNPYPEVHFVEVVFD